MDPTRGLMLHVTPAWLPPTTAENCCDCPPVSVTAAGLTCIVAVLGGGRRELLRLSTGERHGGRADLYRGRLQRDGGGTGYGRVESTGGSDDDLLTDGNAKWGGVNPRVVIDGSHLRIDTPGHAGRDPAERCRELLGLCTGERHGGRADLHSGGLQGNGRGPGYRGVDRTGRGDGDLLTGGDGGRGGVNPLGGIQGPHLRSDAPRHAGRDPGWHCRKLLRLSAG